MKCMAEESGKEKEEIEKRLKKVWDIIQEEREKDRNSCIVGRAWRKLRKFDPIRRYNALLSGLIGETLLIALFFLLTDKTDSINEVIGIFFVVVAIAISLLGQMKMYVPMWVEIDTEFEFIKKRYKNELKNFLDLLYLNYILILEYKIDYFDLDRYLELKLEDLDDAKILDTVLDFYT